MPHTTDRTPLRNRDTADQRRIAKSCGLQVGLGLAAAHLCLAAAPALGLEPTAPEAAAPAARDAKDRIVILASKADEARIGGAADYIDLETLRTHAFEDIHRVLRVVPGVNVQEEDGLGLRPNIGLRGTGLDRSSKITVMEDGVLIAPAPYAAPSAYYFPSTARMSGLAVVKGAAGVKYGPRTQGGSINLISTPIPDAASGRLRLTAGDHETRRAHAWVGGVAAPAEGVELGGLVEALLDETDGFKALPNGADTGYEKDDFVAKVRARFTSPAVDHEVSLKLQHSDEVSNETYLGLTAADFAADATQRYAASALDQMTAEHDEASLRWSGDFAFGLDVSALAYRTDFARDWFKTERVNPAGSAANSGSGGASVSSILADPDSNADALAILRGAPGLVSADGAVLLRHNNRVYYAQGLQLVVGGLVERGPWRHDLEVGVRVHQDEMDRFQWWERFRMDNGTLVRTGVDTPGTESNRIDSAEATAVYVQDTIETGRWIVTPGVRFESIELTRTNWGGGDPDRTGAPSITREDVDAVIPGVGAVFQAAPDWDVFGGVHRGFAPPAPGQAGRDAEEAVNYELGVRHRTPAGELEALAFFNDYSNILGSCTASTGGGCTIGDQFDGGEVDVAGVEASANLDLAGWLGTGVAIPARLAYTFTDATFNTSFASAFGPWGQVQAGDELPYIPRQQLAASLGVDTGRLGGDVTVAWVGETRASAGAGAIPADALIDGRTIIDTSAWVNVGDQVRLTLNVRNLTDETYIAARRPAGLRPGLPRTVLVSVDAQF